MKSELFPIPEGDEHAEELGEVLIDDGEMRVVRMPSLLAAGLRDAARLGIRIVPPECYHPHVRVSLPSQHFNGRKLNTERDLKDWMDSRRRNARPNM
jgi:hypothetical protein